MSDRSPGKQLLLSPQGCVAGNEVMVKSHWQELLQIYFVMTNIIFVVTKLLIRQAHFYRDKRCVLSRQTHVCHDKHICFVMTEIILGATPASDS